MELKKKFFVEYYTDNEREAIVIYDDNGGETFHNTNDLIDYIKS